MDEDKHGALDRLCKPRVQGASKAGDASERCGPTSTDAVGVEPHAHPLVNRRHETLRVALTLSVERDVGRVVDLGVRQWDTSEQMASRATVARTRVSRWRHVRVVPPKQARCMGHDTTMPTATSPPCRASYFELDTTSRGSHLVVSCLNGNDLQRVRRCIGHRRTDDAANNKAGDVAVWLGRAVPRSTPC
jgi:hypothetical protein